MFYCHYTSIVEQNSKLRWSYGLEPLQLRHAATVGQQDLDVLDAWNADRQKEWGLPHHQKAAIAGDWTSGKPKSSFTVFRVSRPASAADTHRTYLKLSFESSLYTYLFALDLLSLYDTSQANFVDSLKLGPGWRRCVCSSLQERNTCRKVRKWRVCMVEQNRNTHRRRAL